MNSSPFQGHDPSPNDIRLPYQRDWVFDQSRFKIGLWARQTGKSMACAAEAVECALGRPGTEWIVLSAGERQALEFMRKAREWTQNWDYAIENYSEDRPGPEALAKSAEIIWANGSRMIALPANPDTARGYSANLILDEFAFHERPAEIWRAIYPSISNPLRGEKKLRIVSTPNGIANKFHELWTRGRNYSKHRVTLADAAAQGLPINVEELRSGLDDPDGWAQEYECEFIDNASVLLPYDLIAPCESSEATEVIGFDFFHSFGRPGLPRRFDLACGIDVGRKRDLTVCWTLQRVGDVWWTREVLVLENTPFHEQLSAILPRGRILRHRRHRPRRHARRGTRTPRGWMSNSILLLHPRAQTRTLPAAPPSFRRQNPARSDQPRRPRGPSRTAKNNFLERHPPLSSRANRGWSQRPRHRPRSGAPRRTTNASLLHRHPGDTTVQSPATQPTRREN